LAFLTEGGSGADAWGSTGQPRDAGRGAPAAH
jgi:hypothetical protein